VVAGGLAGPIPACVTGPAWPAAKRLHQESTSGTPGLPVAWLDNPEEDRAHCWRSPEVGYGKPAYQDNGHGVNSSLERIREVTPDAGAGTPAGNQEPSSRPPGPVLVAVDEDAGALRDVERELCDRYARHYRVMCIRSPREALVRLEGLAAEDAQVALVLAGQRLSATTGSELLDRARHLHPHARRGLLMAWEAWGTERPAKRSSIRFPTAGSTTTWSGRQNRRTRSFTRRSRVCCSTGRRRGAPPLIRSMWLASPGLAGPTS